MNNEEKIVVGLLVNAAIQDGIKDPRYGDGYPDWFIFHCVKQQAESLVVELDRFAKLVLGHDDFIHAKYSTAIDECIVYLSKETNQKTEREILKWKSAELKRRIKNGI